MNQEDVDKIIAEAVAESKNESHKKWHKAKSSSHNVIATRRILNWVFMVGFVAAVAIYFLLPEQRMLFFSIGFGAIAIKLVEFCLRFMF